MIGWRHRPHSTASLMSRGGSDWPSGSPEAGGLSAGSAPRKARPLGGESPAPWARTLVARQGAMPGGGGGLATGGRSGEASWGPFSRAMIRRCLRMLQMAADRGGRASGGGQDRVVAFLGLFY